MAERLAVNQKVVGSYPTSSAKLKSRSRVSTPQFFYDQSHGSLCTRFRDRLIQTGRLGPWISEEDLEVFVAYEFGCVVIRNPSLFSFLGYVILPNTHPCAGKEICDSKLDEIRCHGGITWSDNHTAFFSVGEDQWVIGIHFAHAFDVVPMLLLPTKGLSGPLLYPPNLSSPLKGSERSHYWTLAEARKAVCELAFQLHSLISTDSAPNPVK